MSPTSAQVRPLPRPPPGDDQACWPTLKWPCAPPQRANPVAPAKRSAAATRKASQRRDEHDRPVRSFHAVLDHLATLTRNDIRYGTGAGPVVPTLTQPTDLQRRAFTLLDTPIPLHLAAK